MQAPAPGAGGLVVPSEQPPARCFSDWCCLATERHRLWFVLFGLLRRSSSKGDGRRDDARRALVVERSDD